MSSVLLLTVPCVYPDFGAATIVCEWQKGEGYVVGLQYEVNKTHSAWETKKVFNRLSFALRHAAKLAARCERG